jgi:hypothetical protein
MTGQVSERKGRQRAYRLLAVHLDTCPYRRAIDAAEARPQRRECVETRRWQRDEGETGTAATEPQARDRQRQTCGRAAGASLSVSVSFCLSLPCAQ